MPIFGVSWVYFSFMLPAAIILTLVMIYWNPDRVAFNIPFFNLPIMWYGVFFAFGFFAGYYICLSFLKRYFRECGGGVEGDAKWVVEKLTTFMIIATLIGARVGHFIFYENPSEYLSDPLSIFRLREGGLASHGAAIMIFIFLAFFPHFVRKRGVKLEWIAVLDLIALPTAFAAGFIRLGNFFNQELLGIPTNFCLAVLFGNPLDGSPMVPRHPVQLYESFFYFLTFFILLYLSYKPAFFAKRGRMMGLFLILIFAFRFFIEFLKEEQSSILLPVFSMGQYLSIPLILLGLLFFAWEKFCPKSNIELVVKKK